MTPAGRPPLSGERKNFKMQVMLTESERQILTEAAEIVGQPTSTWARDVLLAAAAELKADKTSSSKKPALRKRIAD